MSTWSGTTYEGPNKNEWFEGEGRFKFPNGVVYEGQFRKGEFHGKGALVYPNGGRYEATWDRGYAVEGHYVFNDGLLYEDKNWEYVSQGDRRFYTEVLEGLQPAGKTLLTNETTPPPIPKGAYDYGCGYYDPKTEQIVSYDGKEVLGYPTEVEEKWIKDHCRKGFEDEKLPPQKSPEELEPVGTAAEAEEAKQP
mmetsp:Transcript_34949/g.69393  ORF Transcript_34949/g.69393 Transcript_34949/m.69393 type:complete len:194 (-) Transcript_34949:194-775(-)